MPTGEPAETHNEPPSGKAGREKKGSPSRLLAAGLEGGEGMVGAVDYARREILEGVLRDAPAAGARSAA